VALKRGAASVGDELFSDSKIPSPLAEGECSRKKRSSIPDLLDSAEHRGEVLVLA
jgi:hypothetical protein